MLDKLVSAWASLLPLQAQKPRCSKRPLYRKGAGMTEALFAVRLLGRCANGNEADGGVKYHAKSQSDWSALCGAKPGKRSAGWSDHPDTMKPVAFVNCPKCRRKLERAPSTNGAVK